MKRVGIDTNLLLLLIVGEAARGFIEKHKRLRAYTSRDYDLLKEVLQGAAEIIVTPSSLAEVSNLAGYGVSEPLRSKVYGVLKAMIQPWREHQQLSARLVEADEFIRLGLTDCGWLDAIDGESVLLTDDFNLYQAALQRGIRTQNFTYVRQQRGLV